MDLVTIIHISLRLSSVNLSFTCSFLIYGGATSKTARFIIGETLS